MSASKYKPYEHYKSLESTYWSRIPSKWNKDMLGRIVEIKGRIGWRGLRSADYRDEGPILLAVGNIGHWGDLITENVTKISREAFNNSPEIVVQNNDLLISKSGTIGRTCVIKDINEEITINAAINILRCSEKIMPKFLHYWIQSSAMQTETSLLSFANAQHNLFQRDMRKLPVFLPSIPEQQKIIQFCVAAEKKLRELEKNLETQISLLEEKRSVLITQAVTKGLNLNTPMKDSGINWIDTIPQHWQEVQLRWIVRMQSGTNITSLEIEAEGTYPVFGGNGLRGYIENYTHEGDHVLIGRQGALCGCINYAHGKFWPSEHAVVVSPTIEIDYLWLGEMLRSMNLGQYSQSAAQPGLSVDRISSLKIPLPPLEEQRKISLFIKNKTKLFNELKDSIFYRKEKIEEYRISLISAVVTGKIDVRSS